MERDNSPRSRHPSPLSWLALAFGAVLALPATSVAQGPGTEDGQWTYLGGDAWHTRYTTADQINASNFEDLEVAWTFNAASFGPSTPRATLASPPLKPLRASLEQKLPPRALSMPMPVRLEESLSAGAARCKHYIQRPKLAPHT